MNDDPLDDLALILTPLAIADPLFPGRYAPAVAVRAPRAAKEPTTLLLDLVLMPSPQRALQLARRRAILLEEP